MRRARDAEPSSQVTWWVGHDTRVREVTEAEVADSAVLDEPVLCSISAQGLMVLGGSTWLRRQLLSASRMRR